MPKATEFSDRATTDRYWVSVNTNAVMDKMCGLVYSLLLCRLRLPVVGGKKVNTRDSVRLNF